MFFEITVTPEAKKIREPISQKTTESNNYSLLLAPFQPSTKIKFDARINTSVECSLTLKNSNDRTLTVSLTKLPPEERCVSFSETNWTIEGRSDVTLNISWKPKEAGSWRDVLYLVDRQNKYEIHLNLTCTDPRKKAPKRDGRPMRQHNPYARPNAIDSKKQIKSKSTVRAELKRTRPIVDKIADKENISHNVNTNWMLDQARLKKQKAELTPKAPLDFSEFLDSSTFKFTPVKSNLTNFGSSAAQEANVFTPNHDFTKVGKTWTKAQEILDDKIKVTNIRKETYVTVPRYLNLEDFQNDNRNGKSDDSFSPKSEFKKPQSEMSKLFDDIKLTPLKPSITFNDEKIIFSPNHCSTATKVHKKSLPEHVPNIQVNKNITFNIDDCDGNITYQLPTSPTKNYLKPTCLAKSFGTNMDIEFSTPLQIKNSNKINETTRFSINFSKSQIDFGSAKDCLEADLWVKSRNDSLSPVKSLMHSTLDSITEEDINDNGQNHEQLKPEKAVFIEISPPKCTKRKSPMKRLSSAKKNKLLKEKNIFDAVKSKKKLITEAIKKNKSMDIPGVRISKLNLSELHVDKHKNVTFKKQPKEVAVKYHNPNDFLSVFCNPDPFGPNMTSDPFLANSCYYDDRWVFMQEVEFKKWFNMILSPPEQLTTDIDSAIIDIGKVWQSCRAKDDVALAETKESVSARYHTNMRLNALRKAACTMYRSADVINVLSKLTIALEKEILTVRIDKDPHRDIGLQKIILELFISYNPLWLRIGLETVYGETIPLQSNNDMIGLSRFLLNRFFSDPFIVKQHSSQAHPTIRLKSFQAVMNKFVLKKFLFLVYFLDHAKKNKLIGHDPCLFHKKAPFKDSRSILLTFSRELLSGIGDITKILRNYNYVVSYKQNVLDEYDYAVKTLSTDLRDGVRLCRVVELMTGQKNLTSQCRVPAISRLQKVHNVKVALTTIKEAGYSIAGDIDANSIADGHREKTLSLLWQLIYKFQAIRYEKAAKTIQSWWKSKLWYVYMKKMVKKRKYDAASVIQRSWKCLVAKRKLRSLKEEYVRELQRKNKAASKIQMYWRLKKEAEKQQKQYQRIKLSAVKIQKWWTRIRTTEPYIKEFRKQRQLVVKLQRRWRAKQIMKRERNLFFQLKLSAIKIQRRWRARCLGEQAVKDYQKKRNAIIFVQRKWRATLLMKKERQVVLKKLRAIRCVQERWRQYLIAKRDRNNFIAIKNAVRTIEKAWIARHTETEERKCFLLQKSSTTVIQRSWRNYRATKEDVLSYKSKKQACIKIQSWWRCVSASKEYRKKRSSCVKIQRWCRSITLGRVERIRYLAVKNSAVAVQKNWKMILTRRDYRSKKSAVLKIESWYENLITSRRVRKQYLKTKAAVKTIETCWLRLKHARQTRSQYLKLKEAAITVQRRWRAQIAMKENRQRYLKMKQSAVKIQSWRRMSVAQKRYREMKTAVKTIEVWRQRLVKTRKVRARYLKMKATAIVVQQRWRAQIAMKENRQRYLKMKQSAVKIQSWRRMSVAQKRYREMKTAVKTIEVWRQRLVKTREVRARYLKMKATAIVVQQKWRAQIAMKENRQRYRKIKQSAVKVQSWWRMISEKQRYKELVRRKNAAVVFQRRWRALKCGRQARKIFVKQRSSIIFVQRKWRAIITARAERRKFLSKRQSVVVIQKHWRRFTAERDFKRIKNAVSMIENWRRCCLQGRQARAEFLKLKMTVVTLQRFLRTKKQVKEYKRQRNAVIKVQNFWKSILKMRECKREYEKQKMACIVIQRRYRARNLAIEARKDYQRQLLAIVTVQRWWKNILRLRMLKVLREKQKLAVILIEKWWLYVLEQRRIREIEKARLLRWHNACVKIQAVWRGYKVRQAASKKLSILRERARSAAKAAVPSATLASRLQENIEIFKLASNIGQLSVCLSSLDVITQLSPNACINVCKLKLVSRLYGILNQANRSIPWLDICLKDISILLTLAKFGPTKPYVLEEGNVEVLARLLNISSDKKEDLFLHTATLIWVLTEDEDYAEAVKQCSRTKYLLSSLYMSINKKITKSTLSMSKCKGENSMPSLKPNWGLNHKRPRVFGNVSQAITSIALRLNILNVFPQTNEIHRSFNFSM